MGPTFWVVLVGLGIAGYLGYRKLAALEREIRSEVAEEQASFSDDKVQDRTGRAEEKTSEQVPSPAGAGGTLEDRLLEKVRQQPGILQTELYGFLPEENRRTVQEVLRRLDGEGRLARTREKGTYRLYPVQ